MEESKKEKERQRRKLLKTHKIWEELTNNIRWKDLFLHRHTHNLHNPLVCSCQKEICKDKEMRPSELWIS